MHPLLNVAFAAARHAGKTMMRQFERVDTLTITEKHKNDFVTEVDKQAERIIIDALQQAFPEHGILSEESGSVKQNDEYLWIIDPLDGTQNYIRGIPQFSISIALQYKGQIEHGLVYDPAKDELFSASRGQGTRLNDHRLRVSQTQQLDQALLGTGFPFRHPHYLNDYLRSFEKLYPSVCDIRRMGSAALDLAYVAAGRFDGFWEYGLSPWDIAAGSLLVTEAGGFVSDFAGEKNYLKSGHILAANPKIFKSILQLFTDMGA
jgi:myo-inositol-1(or 4)-monophosphatase